MSGGSWSSAPEWAASPRRSRSPREVFALLSLEAAGKPGGKMREVEFGRPADRRRAHGADDALGLRPDFRRRPERPCPQRVGLRRAERIARHAWADGARLDLYSDIERSADAIACFAGAREAEGYRRFCRRAQAIYETLRDSFICGARTGPLGLAATGRRSRLPGPCADFALHDLVARARRDISPIPASDSSSAATPPIAARLHSLPRRR